MTRGGHKDENDDVERKCIVTGEVQPKAGLIRFVIGPDNQVVPDILGKLPGRGIYVTADRAILEQVIRAAFKGDGPDVTLAGWTTLGLYEFTRRRDRLALAELLA